MSWKNYLKEGRESWHIVNIKKNNKRWSFRDLESGQISFINVNPNNELGSMQMFLQDIEAKPGTLPKTFGEINYHEFASDVVTGKKFTVYVKSSNFDVIKKTWVLNHGLNESLDKSDIKVLKHVQDKIKKSSNNPPVIFGVNAKDIVKLLDKPKETHRWSNDFFNKVEKSIEKIKKTIK